MYLKNYDISCLINSFAKSNSLFWYYIKQIMNVLIRAMVRIFSFGERWNVLFNSAIASLNRTFHLSPHENILTIALINIHYLYNIPSYTNLTYQKDRKYSYRRLYFSYIIQHLDSFYCFKTISVTISHLDLKRLNNLYSKNNSTYARFP